MTIFRAICFLIILTTSRWSSAQAPAVPGNHPKFDFGSTADCLDCHADPKPRTDRPHDFLGKSAAKVWEEYDKHKDAFNLLVKEEKRVTAILGFPLAEAFTDKNYAELSSDPARQTQVLTVRQCLNCHATWPHDHGSSRPPVPLKFGVACEACHGPGFAWDQAHRREWWRLVTPEGKKSLGFTNVRDPVERAQVCTSCHVGNLAEGKFVTHAWYAAGHPPLPSFEFSTFASAMPMHWTPLREKENFRGREPGTLERDSGGDTPADFIRKSRLPANQLTTSYREANFGTAEQPFNDLPRFKDTVVTSVVVAEAYARLVKDYAADARQDNPKYTWPEFALYDCASCHHELRSGKGYPQRPFGKGIVGRPPAQSWPLSLANLAVAHDSQYDPAKTKTAIAALAKSRNAFELSLTRGQVFGDRKDIEAAALRFEADLQPLLQRLKATPFSEQAANQAVNFLIDPQNGIEYRDYHSARQLAWAVREIAKDARLYPSRSTDPAVDTIDQLFHVPNQPKPDVLKLQLPATQQVSISELLRETLPPIANHDPDRFRQQLQLVPRMLSTVPKYEPSAAGR